MFGFHGSFCCVIEYCFSIDQPFILSAPTQGSQVHRCAATFHMCVTTCLKIFDLIFATLGRESQDVEVLLLGFIVRIFMTSREIKCIVCMTSREIKRFCKSFPSQGESFTCGQPAVSEHPVYVCYFFDGQRSPERLKVGSA